MPYSTLHGEAAKTFEKIYQNALTEYKDKGKAAQTAWAALKKQGYRKGETGEWHKSQLTEFSMSITKASYDTRTGGTMRFRAVASDTEPDLYGEAMSPELFQDFTDRIEHNIPIPEQFKSAICEDTWCGGLPYPSISHFKAGPQGINVPGKLEKVYVDGNRLKSEGVLTDTDLGRAVFKALLDDLYAKKSDAEHKPVRISIGFLDLQHSHVGNGMNYTYERKNLTDGCPMCLQGIGNKVYQKGVLVHLAFTRVPVNPRTEAEVERSMSDAIVTKQDDAASIIGKDLADILVDKSQADVLIVKSDGEVERADSVTREPQLVGRQAGEGKTLKLTDASIYQACYDPNTGLFNQECIDQAMMGHMPAMRKAMSAMYPNASDKEPVPANDKSGKWLALFSVTKKEPDGEHPASHYLAVGDASKPSTWHLQVKDSSGKISPRHLGAAHAALTKGFRGNKYGGPGKGKALAKLRNLYHSAGMKWPEDSDSKKEKAMATNVQKGIPTAPVPGSPEMIDIFDDDELYPEVPSKEESVTPTNPKGMKEPFGTVSNSVEHEAKYGKEGSAKEEASESEAEAEKEGDKPRKSMKEKALVMSARSLINHVVSLKSQGVYGNDALAALQPYMNQFGEAVRRSVTYSDGGDAATAQAIAALTQEIATLKAQLAAQGGTVTRSQVPAPRSLQFNPGTMTAMQQQAGGELGGLTVEKKPFSQIAAIARKSVGVG